MALPVVRDTRVALQHAVGAAALVALSLAASALLSPLHAQVTQRADTTAARARLPLAELIQRASRGNGLPPDLMAYRARVETEVAILIRRDDAAEQVGAIEQVASTLRWTRAGYYDQHVVGYRAQQSGFTLSMLSITPTGWLQPHLYGSRFRLRSRSASDTSSRRQRATSDGADTMPIVHPLAPDRDQWYRYSGGDTVVRITLADREIPIVQVRVQPRADLTTPVVLFDGEISLDASRGTLVRVRGHFVRAGAGRRWTGSLATAVAFVEYEQGERMGKYWLPSRQRIELQAAAPFLGEGRAVIRIASRFLEVNVNDTTLDARTLAAADSLRARARRRLTYAPDDSLSRFDSWTHGVGAITEGMHSDDFNDIGPDRWRPTGRPRLDFTPMRGAEILHFNRVEGLFTGASVRLALRDVAPGVIVRANAGYAWSEQTMRGRLSVQRTRGPWTLEARAGRSLDITNDFRAPFDSGLGVLSVFGAADPYDYVDRSSATLALVRRLGFRRVIARAELGIAEEKYRPASLERSVIGRVAYRENRYIDEGRYFRSAAVVEWNPDVNAEFVKPGLGARLWYERGDGDLDWQRAELRLIARRPMGPFVATSRFDVGSLFGDRLPPQQLFELGQQQNLPGYGDKEFAGSRAAMLRGQLLYISPFLRQPVRLSRRFLLPAIAPGASVGIHAGWAEAPSDAARASIDRLRPPGNDLAIYAPLSRPTDGVRASVSAGLRFFSGSLFLGAARPIDHAAPWKLTVGSTF